MDRGGLDVLVPRKGVHVRAALQQQPCRVDVSEEAGQPERMEAVVAEGVRPRCIFVEQRLQPLRPPQCRRLEHVEFTAGGEPLSLVAVAAVDRFEDGRHR